MFPSPALQSDALNKHFLDKQLSRSVCFDFEHCVKNNLFVARLPGISAI